MHRGLLAYEQYIAIKYFQLETSCHTIQCNACISVVNVYRRVKYNNVYILCASLSVISETCKFFYQIQLLFVMVGKAPG